MAVMKIPDQIETDLSVSFVRIPDGGFVMGGNDEHASRFESPLHEVYISSFHVADAPVTNGDFGAFVKSTGYSTEAEEFEREDTWNSFNSPDRSEHPVVCVSWHDAMEFCSWLSIKIEKPVRLLTEAEWERAARGDTDQSLYPWGNNIKDDSACWGNSSKEIGTSPIRSYPKNRFSLYDMAGNVWEWCSDWYGDSYYFTSPKSDPQGPDSGSLKVRRGASWNIEEAFRMRSSNRGALPPDSSWKNVGFRIAYT